MLHLDHIIVGHDLTIRDVNIHQHFGPERRDPASRNRRAMIEKVWAIWITGVFQPSLPHDILLDLGLTERPVMVTRALDFLVQRPDLADHVQAPGTRLVDIFDRLDSALLILGAPGAGKTTLLLTLAQDLLIQAAQDPEQPIPVVFPLSSWATQRRPLVDWLVDALNEQYDVPRKTGQAWVEADQILPLLDGLDEVALEHRAACVEAINSFRQEHGLLPLVICCRVADYETLETRLQLQGALVVQPLTPQQIESYLTQVGQPVASVRQTLQEEPTLWELLDTPLMLTIMTLAYAGLSVEALRTRGTLVERRQSLFATYVDRMFQRGSAVTRYTRPQTERWLAWLAWQMTQRSQTDFYLERLQPGWLPVGRRWLPTQGTWLLAGIVGGGLTALGAGLGAGLETGLDEALAAALVGALLGAVTGYSREITPIETVRWSWATFLFKLLLPSRRGPRGGLGVALGAGPDAWLGIRLDASLFTALGAGLGAALSVGLVARLGALLGVALLTALGVALDIGLFTALGVGMAAGLGMGLIYKLYAGLVAGLSGGEIATKNIPNEGIHRSVRMAVCSGLASGLGIALLVALGVGLRDGLRDGLDFGLINGLAVVYGSFGLSLGLMYGSFVGLVIGLKYGGRACLQHLVLRLSLQYYDCMPRRYVDFLDYAAERLFLRRVGSGYTFIHGLLLEYFATRYQPDRVDSPSQPPPPPP